MYVIRIAKQIMVQIWNSGWDAICRQQAFDSIRRCELKLELKNLDIPQKKTDKPYMMIIKTKKISIRTTKGETRVSN